MALAGYCSFTICCREDRRQSHASAAHSGKRVYFSLPALRPRWLRAASTTRSVRRRFQVRSEGVLDEEDDLSPSTSTGIEEDGESGYGGRGRAQVVWLVVGIVVATGLVFLIKRMMPSVPVEAEVAEGMEEPARIAWDFFGYKMWLGERTPGWIYFSLLMAAGFGLFVSEEALNVWVGTSLARCLVLGGSREAFLKSLSANAGYIASTVVWVYWGVCISDMVPFYAGRLASRSGSKFPATRWVSKEKVEQVTGTVQRYGNLIGFVERFSLGVRNPTSFLAGVAGIAPERYFAGVCAGALITLPLQLSVGFVLRQHPVRALAVVASFVGAVSILPYLLASLASLAFILRQQLERLASRPRPSP